MALTLIDQLPHLTTRIEARKADGTVSLGTGFFYGFEIEEKGHVSVVVTNKHVVEGAAAVKVWISQATPDGGPMFGTFKEWTIPVINGTVIGHPSPEVDIAMFPLGGIIHQMVSTNTPPFYREFVAAQIPDDTAAQDLLSIEDVYMVGYPTGIWDERNNVPIIRRGITATPYALDYNGRPEFMIDAACFPGSSGSPVIIANHGSFGGKNGGITVGTRLYLLGLLWGGPQFTAEGEIVARPVPTASGPIALSRIPTNLGFCLKAKLLRDFEPLIAARAAPPRPL